MLRIITAPNPLLSAKAKTVAKVDNEIKKLIEQMKMALIDTQDPEGVGLAAPQVGRSLQLFLTKPSPTAPISIFINPVVIALNNAKSYAQQRRKRKKSDVKLEGCLSLPTIWGEVKRSTKVTVKYLDQQGKPHKKIFSGFLATIIQHEYDHLQGILFPKRVLEQQGTLYKSHKNEKNEDVFDEIEI